MQTWKWRLKIQKVGFDTIDFESNLTDDLIGETHNFIQEAYALSHEVSCTLILHPHLVNYIGGVQLGSTLASNPQRIGVVMELMETNLRDLIRRDKRLSIPEIGLKLAKQIASGLNFLHSMNPYILVKRNSFFYLLKKANFAS